MFGARSVAFDQRHFRPIDRNHHARGVGVDVNWDAPQLIGLAEGIDDVELSQLFRRHLDQLGIGVVVGFPVPEERVANALVDCVDRGFIVHGAIVSEQGDALRPMTGNGQKRSSQVVNSMTASGYPLQQVFSDWHERAGKDFLVRRSSPLALRSL